MKPSDLPELHYITPIANVQSIVEHGILCKNRAGRLKSKSVAMQEIQEIRANKAVPGGRPLHDYANLYLCARNPMLYKLSGQHAELCVLRVSPAVLDLHHVVIADGNSASAYTAFRPSPSGLAMVDQELVFAEYWTDADQIVEWQKKRAKCAEVLIPDKVEPRFIMGAYVSCPEAEGQLSEMGFHLPVTINPRLFFRG